MTRSIPHPLYGALALLTLLTTLPADDWPTFGHDSQRSAVSSDPISAPLSLDWVYTPRFPPSHAWGDPQPKPVEGLLELPRLRFDDAFHVAAVGDLVYFGSSSDTKVYALDAKTGKVRWEFFTEGPVRLAPTVWKGKLYVGSDDGKVYCLDAADGRPVWTFDAAPTPRRLLGNGKMISVWPVRTGVVVDRGVAYFGAGVFPSEGLYLYALRADTGQLLWKNDTCGREGKLNIKTGQGSFSPQGYIILSDDKLFVPAGRTMPVAFDRQDGRYLFHPSFSFRALGPFGGTYSLLAGNLLFNGTERILAVGENDGKLAVVESARRLVVDAARIYLLTGEDLVCTGLSDWRDTAEERGKLNAARLQCTRLDGENEWRRQAIKHFERELNKPERTEEEKEKLRARLEQSKARLQALPEAVEKLSAEMKETERPLREKEKWRTPCDGTESIALTPKLAFTGGVDVVKGFDVATGKEVWSAPVKGKARGLAVANGRLLVSTDEGSIHCFVAGEAGRALRITPPAIPSPLPTDESVAKTAYEIVSETGIRRGFALILGGDGQLALELARRTELLVYVANPSPEEVSAARKALTEAGVYGGKVVVLQTRLDALPFADYFANLVVGRADGSASAAPTPGKELLRVLKPCGGVAYVAHPAGDQQVAGKRGRETKRWLKGLQDELKALGEQEIRVKVGDQWITITRGALNGAGSWTHQYADATNSACSDDRLVRGPLGVLWFGSPGPGRMPSRHASAAAPLAANGRMFVQGEEVVMAYDAYNGLLLWERELPGALRLGVSWNGCSNLAANADSLFVAAGDKCLRLDAATGKTVHTYGIPAAAEGEALGWVYVACVDGLLYGSRGPLVGSRAGDSNCVFAYDIESAELRWVFDGDKIMANTVCIGGGRLFFVDRTVTEEQKQQGLGKISPEARTDRLGKPIPPDVRLVVALDARTGKPDWVKPQYVSDCVKVGRGGGELAVMYADNILLLCAQPLNGHFWQQFFAGEFTRRSLIALAADDGRPLWSGRKGYRSRPLIVGDRIIAEPWAHDLRTGAERTRAHPITGAEAKWQMSRPGHHCGSMSASQNALFFRSGTAAYYDLVGDYGTAHFGAQRPGCWINCIPANGVLLMPEASSGCACPYSLQCTTVFHPRKTSPAWGVFSAPETNAPVKHLALNLGAPGDRKGTDGTLWLAFPRPRADRLALSLAAEAELLDSGAFAQGNADLLDIRGTDDAWIYVSSGTGLRRLELPLVGRGQVPGQYRVRLHFVELVNDRPGQRVFDIKLQGQTVLENFDVFEAAGGRDQAVVKEFKGVDVRGSLTLELVPKRFAPARERSPTLSAIEVFRSEKPGLGVVIGKLRAPMEIYNLGYWYADFVRKQAGADLALVPNEALGVNPEPCGPGPVTLGELMARLEDRRIVRSTVSGRELIRYFSTPEAMERFNPYCPGPDPSVSNALYNSGFSVSYNVDAVSASYDLDPERLYTLATIWPFREEGRYGRESPPFEDAQAAEPVPGLSVQSKMALPQTTWEFLAHARKGRRMDFKRRHPSPAPEWEPWKKQIEAAIVAREQAELARLAERFAKELVLTAGVKWRLIAFDDFKRPNVGPKWRIMRGKWNIKNGSLRTGGGELAYVDKLKAPMRIEFDGRSPVPCDLSPFWGSAARGFNAGYFIGFGSNDNARNKILKRGQEVAFGTEPMITPRRWHHVIAQVLTDRVQLIVDGKLILEYVDPAPVKGADTVGIYVWNPAEIANVRIYVGE